MTEASSGMSCLPACSRQENTISTSTYSFPNQMFTSSPDLHLLMRRLYWSCEKADTRFGPKRRLIDETFPTLCGFFDQFVYSNESIRNDLASRTTNTSTINYLDGLGLNPTQLEQFKAALLNYASNNLIRINAFIESPYVTSYLTQEVAMTMINDNGNAIAGDDTDDLHSKHGWDDGTLHRSFFRQYCRNPPSYWLNNPQGNKINTNLNCTVFMEQQQSCYPHATGESDHRPASMQRPQL
jgi:hypothetical protein